MRNKLGIIQGTIIVSLIPTIEYCFIDSYLIGKLNLFLPAYADTYFNKLHIAFHIYILYITGALSLVVGYFIKYRCINSITYKITINSDGLPKLINHTVSTILSVVINGIIPFVFANIIHILFMAHM
ncbi:MAG: hypothetical protein LUH47_05870, partial [Clostridiales bacterium]|nr:hypothetical protein [Clostridiales bacterium]